MSSLDDLLALTGPPLAKAAYQPAPPAAPPQPAPPQGDPAAQQQAPPQGDPAMQQQQAPPQGDPAMQQQAPPQGDPAAQQAFEQIMEIIDQVSQKVLESQQQLQQTQQIVQGMAKENQALKEEVMRLGVVTDGLDKALRAPVGFGGPSSPGGNPQGPQMG